MMEMFYPMIDAAIFKKGGFHLEDLNPEEACKSCKEPVLFIHGKQDKFITPDHSEKNYAAYKGSRDIRLCQGEHNSERPSSLVDEACGFFESYLNEEYEEVKEVDNGLNYLTGDSKAGEGDSKA